MNKKLFFLTILLYCQATYSQTFQFAKNLGGNNQENCLSIATDASGNIYSTGWFKGTADFDPGPNTFNLTASAFKSIYVSKLDSNGNFLWALDFGSSNTNEAFSIEIDNNGDVYVAGQFQDTTDFDPGPSVHNLIPNGWSGAFILKLDSNGNFIWAKDCGGGNNNMGRSLALDHAGNVYLTGEFGGTGDFDPGSATHNLTAQGVEDAFMLKLDSLGNFVWVKQVGQASFTKGISASTDGAGNILVTGTFRSAADFDPGLGVFNLTPIGSDDAFVLKLDSSGNFIWAKNYGGQGTSIVASSMDVDALGDVYITGHFDDTVDFNPGTATNNLISNGSLDAYVVKLDVNGSYVWAINVGGMSTDLGAAIKVQPSGDVYFAGSFFKSADLDPGPTFYNLTSPSQSDFNMYVSKVDNNGNFKWAKSLYANFTIFGNTMTLDSANNIYIGGRFFTSADFDPGPNTHIVNSNGNDDAYVVKFKECGLPHSIINVSGCDSVVVNGVTYNSTGSYTQLYNNTMGCDSNVVVNVQIGGSTISQTACDSFLFGNNVLYSSGTYLDTFRTANCDSIVTLNLTIMRSTTNSLTQSGCDSLIINGQTYTTSGTYIQVHTNSQGCDSIITLNLTIDSTKAVVSQNGALLSATPSGAIYQWLDCNNGNNPILGATAQSFMPTVNGDYAVEVSLNGCVDTSSCINILSVGIKDLIESEKLYIIYPNPTSSLLNIEFNSSSYLDEPFIVYSASGRIVNQFTPKSPNETIDLSDFTDGLYLIRYKNQVKKFILSK